MEANEKLFVKTQDERDMLIMENQKLKQNLKHMKKQQTREYEKLTESIDSQRDRMIQDEIEHSMLTEKQNKTDKSLSQAQDELIQA